MSDLLALDPNGNREAAAQARANPFTSELPPSFFDNAPAAIGMGLERGGVQTVRALTLAASAPLSLYERVTGQEGKYTDGLYRQTDDTLGSAIDFWTPDAKTTGAAGRVLGGFSEIAAPLMLTDGNPALLLANAGLDTSADLVNQGVSAPAALSVGAVQTAATAAGFRLPFLGKTLASRMLTGAIGNTAVNAGSAAVSQEILKSEGFDTQAEQFDPANLEARLVDILSGAAFGGLHHLGARGTERVATDAERAAAATALDAKHFQSDTAPGEPLNVESSIAHQDAMEQAVRQMLEGDPVTVPDAVVHADFAPREPDGDITVELPELKGIDEAVRETHEPVRGTIEPMLAEPAASGTESPKQASAESAAAPAAALAVELPAEPAVPPPPPLASAAETDHPIVTAAREAATTLNAPIPTGEFNPDGSPRTETPAQTLARGDAEIADARLTAKGILAVVTCALARGS